MNTDKTNAFNEIFIKGQTYKDVLSKKDAWKELEKIYNGSLKISTTTSRDVATLTLEIQYKDYKIVLIETDTKPLKIEVNLNLINKYEFNIYLRDWTDKISSFFGVSSTKTANKEFDAKYGIKSKESKLATELLNDNHITDKILENDLYLLALNYDETYKTHKLVTVKDRNTREIKALTELIELEFRLIDSFIAAGALP